MKRIENPLRSASRCLTAITLVLVVSACSQGAVGPTEEAGPEPGSAEAAIRVEAVEVEIKPGSPIGVDAVVTGTWPSLCSQLSDVDVGHSGFAVTIELLATETKQDCPPDLLGLPFRMAIPLNMVEMTIGTYTVTANGSATQFLWDPASLQDPGTDSGSGPTIGYIGLDGNLWVVMPAGEPRQITSDARRWSAEAADQPILGYYFPAISDDGRYLAARRDLGTPIESGYEIETGLWVYDLTTGEATTVYEGTPAGFSWKPGTHLLSYGLGVEENYFASRGQPAPELATGIMAVDIDTGEQLQLAEPERGLALYWPAWSPDGRFLSFWELVNIEGQGPFAYLDTQTGEYVAWEDAIGNYSWTPSGEQILYDRLTYTATGSERIYVADRRGGAGEQLSPEFSGDAYAYHPALSPDGTQLAYLANLEGPESQLVTIFVQDFNSRESRELGRFESVFDLIWMPDGASLLFSAGPPDRQQVTLASVVDGSTTILADGTAPTVSR